MGTYGSRPSERSNIATSNKGITTSNKKLLGTRCIATSNRCIAISSKKLLVTYGLDQGTDLPEPGVRACARELSAKNVQFGIAMATSI